MSERRFRAVKKELAASGITINRQDGEFQVSLTKFRKDDNKAYYTDDLRDAHDTGLAMAGLAPRWSPALDGRPRFAGFEDGIEIGSK